MVEKYKLQYHDPHKFSFGINWARGKEEYVRGDCRVMAIRMGTDVDVHNEMHCQSQEYTALMTLEESREYVESNKRMLGTLIHDCVGLELCEDRSGVDFEKAIQVRNQ